MKRKIIYLAALAALSVAAQSGAYAVTAPDSDTAAIGMARIGLVQAVTAAEQHIGGKASRAEYERHQGQWVFDVEVVKDKTVMDVAVDANSGKVISAVADKADKDREHDEAD